MKGGPQVCIQPGYLPSGFSETWPFANSPILPDGFPIKPPFFMGICGLLSLLSIFSDGFCPLRIPVADKKNWRIFPGPLEMPMAGRRFVHKSSSFASDIPDIQHMDGFRNPKGYIYI